MAEIPGPGPITAEQATRHHENFSEPPGNFYEVRWFDAEGALHGKIMWSGLAMHLALTLAADGTAFAVFNHATGERQDDLSGWGL